MGYISTETWTVEKTVAEQSLATTGHLPTGNELGGRFWDLVDQHYESAVETDHLARFEFYHGPLVTCWETEAHEPVPCKPIPVPPVCHIHVPVPPCHGHTGGVPEPPSIL